MSQKIEMANPASEGTIGWRKGIFCLNADLEAAPKFFYRTEAMAS